jgi:FtsH-binding integral membrane protein
MKMTLSMVFLFGVLLIAWNLQDAGQQLAGAVLMVVSLALCFVLQVGDNK